jgi:pectate lyase
MGEMSCYCNSNSRKEAHHLNSKRLQSLLMIASMVLVAAPARADQFFDNMESGTNGWIANGLWHIVGAAPCGNSVSPTHSWYYGTDATCTYNTGGANSGDLVSPSFAIPANATLMFQSWEQTESADSYFDRRVVYISTNNGGAWIQIFQSLDNAAAWHQVSLDFSAYAGQTAQLRFHFDTVDSIANDYRGWYVDDVLVATIPPAAPSGLMATAVTGNQVDLSWMDNSFNEDGFEIERAPDDGDIPGTWAQIAVVSSNVTTYSDTAVVTNTPFWYRVRAYNAIGDSSYSDVLRVPAIPVTVLLYDTWSSGIRTNQNLPISSAWWASTNINLTAAPGTMTLTVGGSSVQAMTYFTPDSNSPPVELNIEDTLTATFKFMFDGVPPNGSSSQGFRIGLFNFADSTLSPQRVSADGFGSNSQGNGVQGYALFGKMYGTFSDTTPIDIKKRTNLSSSALLGTTGDWTTLIKDSLNTFAFPGFANLTPYSLQFVLRRTGLNSLMVSVTWSNMSTGATLSDSVTDNSASNFRFDGLAFRPQNNSQAPSTNQFTEVKVELASAPFAPTIIVQPQNQSLSLGQDATFTVAATGTLPLRYQWYYNSTTPLADRTNSTLALTNIQLADAGGYSVLVSNPYSWVTSAVATLAVTNAAPVILAQPQDQTVNPGQSTTFSVVANGTAPLSFQWYHNTNTLLSGATAATLTLTNVQSGGAGSYSVVVSNALGSATSSNAMLTVSLIPLPPSGLTASAVASNEVDLSWTDNSSDEDGTKIERALDAGGSPGTWSQIATVGADVTSYVDLTVTTNTMYWYRVRAYNVQGDSPYSNIASALVSRATGGFHTVNGDTTGGTGGPTVTATTAADFINFVAQPGRYIVQVQGTLNVGNVSVNSDKTVLGLGTNATLVGDLYLFGVSNIVVRNLFITNPTQPGEGDGITIKNSSHHIWIDHCTFYDCQDGELDITLASDYVTVSWCKFFYTFNSGHDFVNLIGADDSNTDDLGKLHVTFHHNWWSTLCIERMPRVRFGRVHSYNNYFNAPGNNYCVRAALESQILIEGDYFDNVKAPWEKFVTTGTTGKVWAVSNEFVNVTSQTDPGADPVFTPPYSYTLDDAAGIPDIVTNNAGAGMLESIGTSFSDWQLQYFGCTDCPQAAANADPDGDGQSNTNEFLMGTDPTNSASAFRITLIVRTNNDVRVTWMTGIGKTNALERTVGVAGSFATNNFIAIFTVTNTVDSTTNYFDVGGATNAPSRFYRVRLVP